MREQKRALFLARQSLKKSPDSVSIPEQVAAGRRYCNERGYDLVAVIESENVRGTRQQDKRADLTDILALADRDGFDVLLVWKLDRLARRLRVQENVVYELEQHGVTVESVTEPITQMPMMRQMLGMMAEQFSRDLSARLTVVVSAHVSMGKHQGPAPLGYVRGEDDHLMPDPDTIDAAQAMFRWRVEGHGSPWIQGALREHYGVRLSCFSILRLLENPVYLGTVTGPNGLVVPNAHAGIIDRATWDAVQETPRHRYRERVAALGGSWLHGLVVCGCGQPMYLTHNTYRNKVYDRNYAYLRYRCRTTVDAGMARCDASGMMSARKVEKAALQQLERAFAGIMGRSVSSLVAAMKQVHDEALPGWSRTERQATAKIARLRERQEAINEARIDKRYTREQANTKWQEAEKEIERLQRVLSAGPPAPDIDALRGLRRAAKEFMGYGLANVIASDPRQFRAFLARLGVRVVVRDGVVTLEGLDWVG